MRSQISIKYLITFCCESICAMKTVIESNRLYQLQLGFKVFRKLKIDQKIQKRMKIQKIQNLKFPIKIYIYMFKILFFSKKLDLTDVDIKQKSEKD